ncbi:MAG: ABC transporter ATP-binding protein [Sulfurovum sp.]|nr:ABC transporter ATP-binding protein [Sulfurovum sp.]
MKKVAYIQNLSFAYDSQTILDSIDLTIEQGDFLAIIGPNGGGKSTLLKLMLGLKEPRAGNIEILGGKPSSKRQFLGYVPQNTNVNIDFPIKTIEVVLMGHVNDKRLLFGYGKDETSCAMGALKEVGMQEYANRKIGDLSGGQRQRVMIARALCAHPKILLLDEPTANIDAQGQKEVYDLLKKLNEHITIIVVSHDISVILEYADKVAHINKILSFHDISNKDDRFHTHGKEEHFCEVELLQMLGSKGCKECTSTSSAQDASKNSIEGNVTKSDNNV